ncbi:hypothetical protein Arub01_00350 [Actinomadura rubrobrunea]|uniref:Uncharacterized protein n=1 Tax=Actinomadura rubrobrunea TaxID=115335 RepID=A0A9W6PRP3_9ACTN|nr:hypothetical protein [Actinomadura rubrobrunea]GLW61791.1 hypothetical protein Arub01_00350 [Actinomadura rubrobrunea]
MQVTDEHVKALRSYLSGDPEVWIPVHERLLASGRAEGHESLIWAAFALLVRRKFSPTWSVDKVIRYVASVRASLGEQASLIDARVAESLMCRALGDEVNSEVLDKAGDKAKVHAELVMLMALVSDANMDDSALDELLESAQKVANQWQ